MIFNYGNFGAPLNINNKKINLFQDINPSTNKTSVKKT